MIETQAPTAEHRVRVEGQGTGLAQQIAAGRHIITADEPVTRGGSDTGPSPYQLLLAALGACTSMTLTMYAERKGWPLERVTVSLGHAKVYADDCAQCESEGSRIDRVEREIELDGDLSDEQRQRLLEIADRCPVHRTLQATVDIRTRLTGPAK
ncbi:MAG: OsmC family protein [Acidobacteriota bacterium]